MDFVERLFGFAPDNGSGAVELLWFALMTLAVYAVAVWRQRRSRLPRR